MKKPKPPRRSPARGRKGGAKKCAIYCDDIRLYCSLPVGHGGKHKAEHPAATLRARVAELEKELSKFQTSEFNPDWSLLKRTQENLRESWARNKEWMARAEAAEARVRQLEEALRGLVKVIDRAPDRECPTAALDLARAALSEPARAGPADMHPKWDGCTCPNPELHRELADGRPINAGECYEPEFAPAPAVEACAECGHDLDIHTAEFGCDYCNCLASAAAPVAAASPPLKPLPVEETCVGCGHDHKAVAAPEHPVSVMCFDCPCPSFRPRPAPPAPRPASERAKLVRICMECGGRHLVTEVCPPGKAASLEHWGAPAATQPSKGSAEDVEAAALAGWCAICERNDYKHTDRCHVGARLAGAAVERASIVELVRQVTERVERSGSNVYATGLPQALLAALEARGQPQTNQKEGAE